MRGIEVQARIYGKFGKAIYSLNRKMDRNYNIGYPHITLLDYTGRDSISFIREFEKLKFGLKPFRIFVSGVGSWDKRWVYLKVKKSSNLKHLHLLFYKNFKGKTTPDFEPKRWIPHITVADNLSEFEGILNAVRKRNLKFEQQLDTLYVVKKSAKGFKLLKRYKL